MRGSGRRKSWEIGDASLYSPLPAARAESFEVFLIMCIASFLLTWSQANVKRGAWLRDYG